MNPQIALVLILLVAVVILFSLEFIPLEIIALSLLSVLLVSGILDLDSAFQGFGSETVVMVAGLFVMTEALVKTGFVDGLGRLLQRHGGRTIYALAFTIMLSVAVAASFIGDTAAAAIFVPAVMGLARRARLSPSKLLMPVAFAAIMSSSVTLISTSTNLVISGLMTERGLPPLGMFELTPMGIPIAVAGLLYMLTIGIRLLPNRADESIERDYDLPAYITELIVLPDSPLCGTTIGESSLGTEIELKLLLIVRGGRRLVPHALEVLRPSDLLIVQGRLEDIVRIKETAGLEIEADFKLGGTTDVEGLQLVEAMIMPGSDLRGRTLKEVGFRERFGLTVLAINRRGETLHSKLSGLELRIGDVLLLEGPNDVIRKAVEEGHFTLLTDVSGLRPRSRRARYAVAAFAGVVAVSALNLLPFAAAVVIGVLMMFLFRVITPEEAYNAVEWRIIVLIGCMLAFGAAMEKSGGASFIAHHIISYAGGFGPELILASFFLLTVLLTQPMSNEAAALVLFPVAMQTATALQLNPRPFAIMIAVASSCSYLTPLEPSCILVYGAGRYRFFDFFKVGALLTVIIFLLSLWIVPRIWPLV